MPFCAKCGTQMEDNAKFCPSCGNPVEPVPVQAAAPAQQAANSAQQPVHPPVQQTPPVQQQNFAATAQKLIDTPDSTAEYDPNDIAQNKVMSVLSYFGLLFLIPMFAAKESKFARFHVNQGLVLFITNIAVSIVSGILNLIKGLIQITKTEYFMGYPYQIKETPWFVSLPIGLVTGVLGLAILALMIFGIVNAATGKAKELPLIGKFKLLK